MFVEWYISAENIHGNVLFNQNVNCIFWLSQYCQTVFMSTVLTCIFHIDCKVFFYQGACLCVCLEFTWSAGSRDDVASFAVSL